MNPHEGDGLPDNPPRRRITDNDRRRWNDDRLDDLKEDVVDVQAEQRAIAALYRQLAPLPKLLEQYMGTTDKRLDRMHIALENLRDEQRRSFERNFSEHRQVKATADEIAQTVKPGRLDAAVKYATIISFLLVPILAAWVASGQ